jgi:hypothetical protein
MKYTATLATAILLSACTSPQPNVGSSQANPPLSKIESSDETVGCSVYVYRNKTWFHRFNPEKPFVYVGDERVGKLGVGDSVCLRMPEGKYTVSIKEPILFMPTYAIGKVDIEVRTNAPVYVRYSKEFSGVIVTGSTTAVTGNNRVQVVTEANWRDRL